MTMLPSIRRSLLPALAATALVAGPVRAQVRADTADTTVRHAVDLSDAFYTRLRIHQVGAYAILPLFPAEYLLGKTLIDGGDYPGWVKPSHVAVASAIGALTLSNSVTGVMNLWEERHIAEGRKTRTVHAITMLAADAGFAATGLVAGRAKHSDSGAQLHQDLAIGSMAVMAAGSLAMRFLWRD
jgi:hypothetical protein